MRRRQPIENGDLDMLPPAHQLISSDPTNHGSNIGAVVLFGLGIFVLIGLLAFLITRSGRRPLRPTVRALPPPQQQMLPPGPRPQLQPMPQPQLQPMPGPRRDSEHAAVDAAGAGTAAGSVSGTVAGTVAGFEVSEQGSASDTKSSQPAAS
jgi:hypothetical protein